MTWVLVVLAFVAVDALTILVVRALVRKIFDSIARPYPPREPAPNSVQRRYQQFRMGIVNLGLMHVAVDDEFLHLRPSRILVLLGVRPASIPWSAMKVRSRSRSGRRITVDIASGPTLEGPAWCMELVEPSDATRS